MKEPTDREWRELGEKITGVKFITKRTLKEDIEKINMQMKYIEFFLNKKNAWKGAKKQLLMLREQRKKLLENLDVKCEDGEK